MIERLRKVRKKWGLWEKAIGKGIWKFPSWNLLDSQVCCSSSTQKVPVPTLVEVYGGSLTRAFVVDIKKLFLAGMMTQGLTTLAALAEDDGLVPNTYPEADNHLPFLFGNPFLDSKHQADMWHTGKCADTTPAWEVSLGLPNLHM